MYSVLSGFSGVGGLERGIEYAGLTDYFQVTQFIELNPYRRSVLQKHHSFTRIHDDIRTFKPDHRRWDIFAAGTPCPDISLANPKRNGFDGERSGLWWDWFKLIVECKPKFVIWENVGGARYTANPHPINGHSPLAATIGCFASLGYLCEWIVVPASDLGAPHKRERLFLIAYSNGTLTGEDLLQCPWSRQVGDSIERTWDNSEGGDLNVSIPAMDAGLPFGLSRLSRGGWWKSNNPPQIISTKSRSVQGRMQRVQAIGDSCTPQQSALCWERIHYLRFQNHSQSRF